MKNYKEKVLLITRTAVLIALLIVFQFATSKLGQFVTGSLVNMVLVLSAFSVGLYGGLAVAVLSPVFAYLLGISPPIIQLVPVIMLGNAAIVCAVALIAGKKQPLTRCVAGVAVGAVVKFFILWLGVSYALALFFPALQAKIAKISQAFFWPQLVTAAIGGALAIAVWFAIRPALAAASRNTSSKE